LNHKKRVVFVFFKDLQTQRLSAAGVSELGRRPARGGTLGHGAPLVRVARYGRPGRSSAADDGSTVPGAQLWGAGAAASAAAAARGTGGRLDGAVEAVGVQHLQQQVVEGHLVLALHAVQMLHAFVAVAETNARSSS